MAHPTNDELNAEMQAARELADTQRRDPKGLRWINPRDVKFVSAAEDDEAGDDDDVRGRGIPKADLDKGGEGSY